MRKLKLQELNRLTPEAFKATPKVPIIIVLDNIRSALNVGSAFRTSDAFAIQEIVLCGISAQPPHREILKTAIGATDTVNWIHKETPAETIDYLKSKDFQIIAIEQAEESVSLEEFKVEDNRKYALVFGNEVKGVHEDFMEKVDHCIEVPQFGTKHSLNISVCLGIVVWEIFRKMKF